MHLDLNLSLYFYEMLQKWPEFDLFFFSWNLKLDLCWKIMVIYLQFSKVYLQSTRHHFFHQSESKTITSSVFYTHVLYIHRMYLNFLNLYWIICFIILLFKPFRIKSTRVFRKGVITGTIKNEKRKMIQEMW